MIEHSHYTQLCYECGEMNEKKRLAKHDLSAYIALVTGGRIKIGYYTALRLLRNGARVIVTTRFPYDAFQRYIQEPDFEDWKDRIHIYGLDFRRIERVEDFAHFLQRQFPYIDLIVNNAAQTVRMTEEEYNAVALNESKLKQQLTSSKPELLLGENPNSPIVHMDTTYDFQQLQLIDHEIKPTEAAPSRHNSWVAASDQISLVEMLEVQLINVTAPFLLNTKLKPLMLRSPNRNRFIINVSSVEGKFSLKRKGRYHVHTNMAKASLNMMTLTMAKEYKRHRIFITSVDPGWVSNQYPTKAEAKSKIQLPLDFHDAASRICDPVYQGKDAEQPATGVFFKDYKPVDW